METVKKGGAKPVPHVRVEMIGIWRTLSSVLGNNVASPVNVIFLQPPLYADRLTKTRCQRGVLTVGADDDKTLVGQAKEGSDRIQLSNSKNLKPKDLLKIDVGDPDREEVLGVKNIGAGLVSDQPAWVILERPVMKSHREAQLVQRFDQNWSPSIMEIVTDGYQGDRCAFLDNLQELKSGDYVRFSDASSMKPAEYHKLTVYQTDSDDDGFFQLPPLQRVAQVQLRASKDGKKKELTFQPDYSLSRNQVDFILPTS